jgi:arylsulfatase A-like enzyme
MTTRQRVRREPIPAAVPAYLAIVLAAAWLVPAMGVAAEQPADRPNFVLCMTDDQGWGDVSYNGLKSAATPNLDAMAAAGLRFDRFYAAAPYCSPTRGSFLTGRHPIRYGVFGPGRPLRPQEITVAQVLGKAGYATGHFGKWHLNGVSGPGKVIAADDPLSPGKFGFEEWLSVSNYFELNWTLSRRGEDEKFEGDGSDYIVAEAVKFIADAVAGKRPFLAVVWFGNPHSPHQALPEDIKAAGGSVFYGEIVGIDRSMGTLRSELRRLGVADNTFLLFCSDNGAIGPGSTGGLRGRKGTVWEGGVRVPGIIEWPARIKKPARTNVPVVTSDVYPTILALTGLKAERQVEPLDGVSLVPLLDGKMTERPAAIGFWHYGGGGGGGFNVDGGHAALTGNRFKLHKLAADKYELYDLAADAEEATDVAADNPNVVASMKTALAEWQASVARSYRGEDYKDAAARGE